MDTAYLEKSFFEAVQISNRLLTALWQNLIKGDREGLTTSTRADDKNVEYMLMFIWTVGIIVLMTLCRHLLWEPLGVSIKNCE